MQTATKNFKTERIQFLSFYLALERNTSLAAFACSKREASAVEEEVTAAPYEQSPNEDASIKLVSDFIALF